MNPMGFSMWVMASCYASASLLCFKVAGSRLASQGAQHLAADSRRVQMLWACCAMVLAVLAVLAVWRLDLVLGEWLRQGLRDSGWYPMRRPLQVGALMFSLWLSWLVLSDVLPAGAGGPLLGCVAGTSLLLFVSWGRLLSWHSLDAVLNARWAGISAGRWLEALGLCTVAVFATWQWRVGDV